MKKLLLLSLPLIIVSAFLLTPLHASAATYYVDPAGSDSNNGTSSSTPWQTLTKVNSVSFAAGDQVLFKDGGTWTGSLSPLTGGVSGNPITFSSYGTGAKPVISGFQTLSGWTSLGNGIYGATCTNCGSTVDMVTMNGTEQAMGRYPNADAANDGYLQYQSGTASSTGNSITSSSLGATNWTGATLVARTTHWVLGDYPITSQSGTTINYGGSSYTPNANFGFFIENDPRTLDELGEWYYNPATKQLEMYFGANSPTSYTIQAAAVGTLVTLAHGYITLNGFSLQGSVTDAIIPSGVGITVQNTDINFSGTNAIDMNGASYFTLHGSTIANTNNNGIFFSYIGNNSYATITNNTFTNTGVIPGMGGTRAQYVAISQVEYNNNFADIEQNVITSTGYVGILFGNNGTVIKNNLINIFCTIEDDGGGIYTGGGTTLHPVTRQVTGNIVLNGIGAPQAANSTTYLPAEGIYMDQITDNVNISGNTIANMADAGLFMNSPIGVTATNNTVYSSGMRGIYIGSSPTPVNLVLSNNKIISPNTAGIAALSTSSTSVTVATFATLDNNYYMHNSNVSSILGTVYGKPSYTLAQWQTAFNQDLHSDDVTVPSGTKYQFFYNPTTSPVAETLPSGTYSDITGATYAGSVTVPAYGSIALVPSSSITIKGPITSDITPPTISITAPSAGTTVSGSSVSLTATAADNVAVASVQFKLDNTTNIGSADTTAPYGTTWNSTAVANGTHTITAVATDTSGNTTTSNSITLTINNTVADTTAPTVSVTAPTASAIVSGATTTLIATASDNVGVASVQFAVDGTVQGSPIIAAPYSYTLDTTKLTNATHTITAIAKDAAGNSTTSAGISVTVDNTVPIISSIATSGIATTGATISWTTNKAATSQVEYGLTTGYGTTTTFNSTQGTNHSVTVTGLSPSTTYHFAVMSIAANNMLTTSADQTFTTPAGADTTPPTVSITAPTANASVSGSTISLTATAADNVAVASVQFKLDNTTNIGSADTTAPYGTTWNSTAVANGTHTITAVATDTSGNTTTSSPVTITVNNIVNVAPIISAVGVSTVTSSSATIAWITDQLTTSQLQYGTTTSYGATVTSSSLLGAHSASLTGLTPDTIYHYRIVSTIAGALTTTSPDFIFTTATVTSSSGNGAPVISVLTANPDAHTAVITWVTDQPSDDQIEYGSTTGYGSFSIHNAVLATIHSVTLTNLLGSTTYHYRIEDTTANGIQTISPDETFLTIQFSLHGNVTVAATTMRAGLFRLTASTDSTPPTVSLTSPVSNTTISGTNTMMASANDNSGVSSVQFTINGVVVAEPTASPYTFIWDSTSLPNGSYAINAVAYDTAGNATASNTATITISNPAPILFGQTAPVTTPTTSSGGGSSGGGGGGGGGGGATGTINYLPAGCTNLTVFSVTTGMPCNGSASTTSTTVTIPTGCLTTTMFSPLNGQKCPNYTGVPATGSSSTTTTTTSTGGGIAVPLITQTLSLGMRSSQVVILQHFLNTHGFTVAVSGAGALNNESTYFGPATKLAVQKFQKTNGISATGTIGAYSRSVINSLLGGTSSTSSGQVTTTSPAVVTTPTVIHVAIKAVLANIRSNASITGSIITTLPQGTQGTEIGSNGSWIQASFSNGITGWVSTSTVTIF